MRLPRRLCRCLPIYSDFFSSL